MKWTYSSYRATLRRYNKFFALVSDVGGRELSKSQQQELLSALNRKPKLCEQNLVSLQAAVTSIAQEMQQLSRRKHLTFQDLNLKMGLLSGLLHGALQRSQLTCAQPECAVCTPPSVAKKVRRSSPVAPFPTSRRSKRRSSR